MSFEKGIKELEKIVKKLELEQTSLEDSIADWEKGMKIVEYCKRKIKDAEDKVNSLQQEESHQDRLVQGRLVQSHHVFPSDPEDLDFD